MADIRYMSKGAGIYGDGAFNTLNVLTVKSRAEHKKSASENYRNPWQKKICCKFSAKKWGCHHDAPCTWRAS